MGCSGALSLLPLTAALAAAAVPATVGSRPAAGGAGARAGGPWARSALTLIAVIAVEIGATFVTPLDGAAAVFMFAGVSLLVAAVRGDAGCEAVAIPNAIAGRTDPTGCIIYSPLDAVESARRSRRRPRSVREKEALA